MEKEINKEIETTLKCKKCGKNLSIILSVIEHLKFGMNGNGIKWRKPSVCYIRCECGNEEIDLLDMEDFLRKNFKDENTEVERIIVEIKAFLYS